MSGEGGPTLKAPCHFSEHTSLNVRDGGLNKLRFEFGVSVLKEVMPDHRELKLTGGPPAQPDAEGVNEFGTLAVGI